MFHPSFYTLSPVIGVSLIIWFSNKDEIITKILSTKLFVGMGLISYSLYLWHYPIFAFARVTEFFGNNLIKELSSGIVILVLSIFSYFFIEKPFRNYNFKFKKIIIILIFLITLLFSFGYYVITENGIKNRFNDIFLIQLKEENTNFHERENVQKIVLIGDSHSKALEHNLNEQIKINNLSFYKFDTIMYLDDFVHKDAKTQKNEREYTEKNAKISNFLKNNPNLIVILHYRWQIRLLETLYDNQEGYKEATNLEYQNYLEPINTKTKSLQQRQKLIKDALISQIKKITNQGHKLILVYPVPEMGFNVPSHLLNRFMKEKINDSNSIPILSGSYELYKKRNKIIFDILDNVEDPNVYRVYPHHYLCNTRLKGRCIANDEKNIFYYDDDHLSIQGSKMINNLIIKKIKKIVKNDLKNF